MNTRFEVAMWGRDEVYLNSVGEAVLEEIHRLERQLSLYRDDSDIHELNLYAAHRAVTVEPRLFYLLARAKGIHAATGGAFDITVAPLMRAWGFMGASGHMPDPVEVAAARELIGMHLVELNEEDFTVRFLREGVVLDLGAIGKGYAIEQAAEMLREFEVGGALIHGGTSTVQAIGAQPDGSPWPVAIQHLSEPEQYITVVNLQDSTLSVSAIHGKSFTQDDVRYGHVLDPRTGAPVRNALLSAVVCDSATDGDALSTALLIQGESFLDTLPELREEARGLVVVPDEDGAFAIHSRFPIG
jgi:thiamine biosynthesis lipoprotein